MQFHFLSTCLAGKGNSERMHEVWKHLLYVNPAKGNISGNSHSPTLTGGNLRFLLVFNLKCFYSKYLSFPGVEEVLICACFCSRVITWRLGTLQLLRGLVFIRGISVIKVYSRFEYFFFLNNQAPVLKKHFNNCFRIKRLNLLCLLWNRSMSKYKRENKRERECAGIYNTFNCHPSLSHYPRCHDFITSQIVTPI